MNFDCVLGAWGAHESELLGFLVRRMRERAAAEDLLQEVFLKAMRQGKNFCALDDPRAWLFMVARNTLIDHVRGAKPLGDLPHDLATIGGGERAPVDELDACLVRNMAELAPGDRKIIEDCDLAGQLLRVFAEREGISLAAAKSRLLRARQRLRYALVRNCQVHFDESGRVCCHVPRGAG